MFTTKTEPMGSLEDAFFLLAFFADFATDFLVGLFLPVTSRLTARAGVDFLLLFLETILFSLMSEDTFAVSDPA